MIFDSVLVFIVWFSLLIGSIYGLLFRNRCKDDLDNNSVLQQYSYLTATLTGALLFMGYSFVEKFKPSFEKNYVILCSTIISIAVTGITINFIKKCNQKELTENSMWVPGITLSGPIIILIITLVVQTKTKKSVI